MCTHAFNLMQINIYEIPLYLNDFLYIYEIIIFTIKFLEILADELVINDS